MKKKFIILTLMLGMTLSACGEAKTYTLDSDGNVQESEGEYVAEENEDGDATEDDEYYEEEYYVDEAIDIDNYYVPQNPSWERYYLGDDSADNFSHVTLEKLTEDSMDWLDTNQWAEEHGFEYRRMPYSDGNYYYQGICMLDDYAYNELCIYDKDADYLIYDYDLENLCYGPDLEENMCSNVRQSLMWAQIEDDTNTLYISIANNGYASEEPRSAHMLAINMETSEVIWRSDAQVAGMSNFIILDNSIICGYGFTAEPDYIYILDKRTGETIEQISVASAPEQFELVGDTLYVATYNTAYEFRVK